MDDYGCMKNELLEWDDISKVLRKDKIITFCYSADNYTAFVITIAGPIHQTGTMAFGGRVDGTYMVALLYRGMSYFDFHSEKVLHFDYVGEKLGLTNESDSKVIADLLNEMRKRFRNE